MFEALRRLFRRAPAPAAPAGPKPRAKPPVPRVVHVFTCAFETTQGFLNYTEQHWSSQDAEPVCAFEQDLALSSLDRNYIDLIEGGPEAVDAHVRPLLKHGVDADAVFLNTPRVAQAILIYDIALPADAPALRATRSARYVGCFELAS